MLFRTLDRLRESWVFALNYLEAAPDLERAVERTKRLGCAFIEQQLSRQPPPTKYPILDDPNCAC
jgi:hypothetical protein